MGAMAGGTAGVLRRRLADELGVFGADVIVRSVGGEGTAAVPLPCYCTVNGIPMTELLSYETVQDLVSPVPEPGDDYPCDYSLAASVADMVECIVRDRKRILTAAVMLDGEYGRRGSCAAVPVIVGTHGVEKILELQLLPEERLHFDRVVDRLDAARR